VYYNINYPKKSPELSLLGIRAVPHTPMKKEPWYISL
jgi:hypothetical protein